MQGCISLKKIFCSYVHLFLIVPNNIQLSTEGEVNSGGYIARREASRYISTALTDPEGDNCFSIYQIRWIKKCCFINGTISSSETFAKRRAIFTGANQNVRKLLSTDLVNTNGPYSNIRSTVTDKRKCD